MAPSTSSGQVGNVEDNLSQLEANGINITSFFDDEVKPRQPLDPHTPDILLREGEPDTPTLEPREYHEKVLSKVLPLVEKAGGSVKVAKAALTLAIEKRKTGSGKASKIKQVLPRDLKIAMGFLGRKSPTDESRKRAADSSSASDTRPTKKVAAHDNSLSAPTSKQAHGGDANKESNVITAAENVPHYLSNLIKRASDLKKTAPPAHDLSGIFNSCQTDDELFMLLIRFQTAVQNYKEDHDPDDLLSALFCPDDLQTALCKLDHAEVHWKFKRISTLAAAAYEKFKNETGMVLSQQMRDSFEVPLPCCNGDDFTDTHMDVDGHAGDPQADHGAGEHSSAKAQTTLPYRPLEFARP
ncbi:hypothetical protein HDK77DRAFT_489113 [Phyllosticta capitalensis]